MNGPSDHQLMSLCLAQGNFSRSHCVFRANRSVIIQSVWPASVLPLWFTVLTAALSPWFSCELLFGDRSFIPLSLSVPHEQCCWDELELPSELMSVPQQQRGGFRDAPRSRKAAVCSGWPDRHLAGISCPTAGISSLLRADWWSLKCCCSVGGTWIDSSVCAIHLHEADKHTSVRRLQLIWTGSCLALVWSLVFIITLTLSLCCKQLVFCSL